MKNKTVNYCIVIGYVINLIVSLFLYHTSVSDRTFLYWAFLTIIWAVAYLIMRFIDLRNDNLLLLEKMMTVEHKLDKLELEYLKTELEYERKRLEELTNQNNTI